MATHEVAQSVPDTVPRPGDMGGPVEGPDGRTYHKVPNHPEGVVWWFDADWNPTPNPFAPPQPDLTEEEMIARSHEFADEDTTIAKCYFIGGDEGPVKIGYSVDVPGRLRAHQSSSPVKLRILATASGGLQRECAYHWQFADARLHGEWFERTPEIEAEIARLNAAPTP